VEKTMKYKTPKVGSYRGGWVSLRVKFMVKKIWKTPSWMLGVFHCTKKEIFSGGKNE